MSAPSEPPEPGDLRTVALEIAPRLRRYAHTLLGDAEAARDVVQDVLVRIHDRGRPEPRADRPAAYLFAAVRNRCTDHLRKEKRVRPLSHDTGEHMRLVGHEPDPAASATTGDSSAVAVAELENLPPAQREVLRLKFSGGLSYAEIADVTGKTANNVGVLCHLGLKSLRAALLAKGIDHA